MSVVMAFENAYEYYSLNVFSTCLYIITLSLALGKVSCVSTQYVLCVCMQGVCVCGMCTCEGVCMCVGVRVRVHMYVCVVCVCVCMWCGCACGVCVCVLVVSEVSPRWEVGWKTCVPCIPVFSCTYIYICICLKFMYRRVQGRFYIFNLKGNTLSSWRFQENSPWMW